VRREASVPMIAHAAWKLSPVIAESYFFGRRCWRGSAAPAHVLADAFKALSGLPEDGAYLLRARAAKASPTAPAKTRGSCASSR